MEVLGAASSAEEQAARAIAAATSATRRCAGALARGSWRAGCGAGAPDEATGQRVGRLAAPVGDVTSDDGGHVAVGRLHEPATAGRQVASHLGPARAQVLEVDQVQVGAVAGCDHATVEQTNGPCGRARLTLHEERQLHAPPVAVAPPPRQQRRREAGVADRADVRTAVGEPRHRVLVGEHLADGVEAAVEPVDDRQVEEAAAVVAGEQVVGELEWLAPLALGPRRDARRGTGLVVGRVGELEHAAEVAQEARTARLRGGQHPLLHAGARHRPRLVSHGQGRDLLAPGSVVEQGVEGALQPEQDADGAGCGLATHGDPVGVRLLEQLELASPGASCRVSQRERQRPAGARRHGPEERELGVDVVEVGHHLEHAATGRAHRSGDADQLVGLRREGRRQLAAAAAVVARARRAEAQRAGLDALAGQGSHGVDVEGGRRFTGCAALAHDVQSQGTVGHLRGEVDVEAAAVERVEELREGLPRPGQPLVQRRTGDVLDALHELDEPFVVGGADRCEADAAVPGDHGGHAVPGRRDQAVVPGRLAVVVHVDVDEAGGDDQPVGVDAARRRPVDPPDLGHHAAADRDVGRHRRPRRPVDDLAAPDDEVVH